MPLYDYRCTECDREVEVRHGIDGHGPATCETCGGSMRKALSTPAIHFKGSGWAKKDAQAAAKAKPTSSGAPKPSTDEKAVSEPSGSESKTPSTSDTATSKDSVKSSTSTAKKTD